MRCSHAKESHTPRLAKDQLKQVLDDMSKSRKLGIELKGVEFANELSNQLVKHSEELERVYSKLQKEVAKDVNKEEVFKPILSEIEKMNKWFTKAEVGIPIFTLPNIFAKTKR